MKKANLKIFKKIENNFENFFFEKTNFEKRKMFEKIFF